MLCRSSGDPPPRLVWGGSGAGRRSDLPSEGSIVTTQLNVEASRSTADTNITCSSINTTSDTVIYTVATTLRVNLPPLKVTLEAPGAWVSAGQQTTFRCRVEGSSPEPVVQWWLGGRQLEPSTPPRVVEGKVSVSTVRLTPEPGDHGALLVCKAFSPNLAGTVLHDQRTLAVHFLPVAVSKVEGGGTQANVREGGVVTFTCTVTANPKVYSVSWYHNGRRVQEHTRAAMVTNSSLTLRNVTAKMRGLYTCVGSNGEGDGQSNALNLNVEFVPVCRPGRRRDFVVDPEGSVNLECGVEAHPAALTYNWAIVSQAEASAVQSLPSSGRVEGLTGHYRLTGVGRRLTVLCWAKNTVGAQTKPCRLTVHTQGRPQPVRSCRVGNNTAAGFAVLCQPSIPSGSDIRYTLLVYAQNNPRGSDDEQGGAGERNEVMWPSGGEEVDPEHPTGDLLLNLTSTSPEFEVGGLQAGPRVYGAGVRDQRRGNQPGRGAQCLHAAGQQGPDCHRSSIGRRTRAAATMVAAVLVALMVMAEEKMA
ncbi:hemicentin-2-like [Scylla paramamosain]|uniref:hemicentin-2-like n=1 Tax=Scylla paramamosain TaxID=85552 RepID=UPI0030833F07